jgi:hypothetical protein
MTELTGAEIDQYNLTTGEATSTKVQAPFFWVVSFDQFLLLCRAHRHFRSLRKRLLYLNVAYYS